MMKRASRIGAALTSLFACGPVGTAGDTDAAGETTGDMLGDAGDVEASTADAESGAGEPTPPFPEGESCSFPTWGMWHEEAPLPNVAGPVFLLADEHGYVAFGANSVGAPSVRVFVWAGAGEAWDELAPIPLAASVSAATTLRNGRRLVIGDDVPRSVWRSTRDGWEQLGTLDLESGHVSLGQTSIGTVVAYRPQSGTFVVSASDGERWTSFDNGPHAFHGRHSVRVEPNGPVAVRISAPGVLTSYSLALGDTIPSPYSHPPVAVSSVPWLGDRRFGMDLRFAHGVDQSEILQHRVEAVLFDAESSESLGFECFGPIVAEYADLDYELVTHGRGRIGVLGGQRDTWRKDLAIYDQELGWARAPAFPGEGAVARVAMLEDGSVLAVGIGEPNTVWRWAPE
jgi:hypothetical protein